MAKIVICYSGGLDSRIMYELALSQGIKDEDITKVFFDIGQPYLEKEKAALPCDVEVRKLEWLDGVEKFSSKEGSKSGNIIIPGRNAVLCINAASIYLPDEIWMGGLLGEMHDKSTDKNWKFISKMNALMEYVYCFEDRTPKLRFPLAEEGFGKFEATEWAYDHGLITEQELIETSSCLSGEEGKCGKCLVCLRRWGIFKQLGFGEEYNIDNITEYPANVGIIKEMIVGELTGSCHYDEYRRREIIPALLDHYDCTIEELNDIYEGLSCQE